MYTLQPKKQRTLRITVTVKLTESKISGGLEVKEGKVPSSPIKKEANRN